MAGVIILAAGTGNRLNLGFNKMLVELNGVPLYKMVVDKYRRLGFDEIILVVSENDFDNIECDCKKIIGGSTRAKSVYNGLRAVKSHQVIIHDGARPFTTDSVIMEVLERLKNCSAVVVGKKVVDTIKDISNGVKTLDREKLIAVETPQAGLSKLFLSAYEQGINEEFVGTDDMSYLERYTDTKIEFVIHNTNNMKITESSDLEYAKYLLSKE